jgi:hypothetical protein
MDQTPMTEVSASVGPRRAALILERRVTPNEHARPACRQ